MYRKNNARGEIAWFVQDDLFNFLKIFAGVHLGGVTSKLGRENVFELEENENKRYRTVGGPDEVNIFLQLDSGAASRNIVEWY
jgi:hypothetical protein